MKKLWIWLAIIIGVIGVMVTLCFTLFGLNKVEIEFETSTIVFSEEKTRQEIIETANFAKGSCVLFLNKQQATETLEEKFPYLKVVNIETIFPNNLVIHLAEREECFAFQISENKFAITDDNLKVLKIIDNFETGQANAILVKTNLNLNFDINASDELSNFEILNKLSEAFKLNSLTILSMKSLIKNIEIIEMPSAVSNQNSIAIILIDYTNFVAKIIDANQGLEYKINAYLTILPKLTSSEKEQIHLYVYHNLKGQIFTQKIENN